VRERQALYEWAAAAALAEAYPDASINHVVDTRTDASRRIAGWTAADGDEMLDAGTEDTLGEHVAEILDRAWQDAREAIL